MSRRLLLFAAAALAVAAVAPSSFAEDWERAFAREMARPESWARYAAVTGLDPANAKARDMLLAILDRQHWWLRSGAIDTLSKAPSDALDDLRKELKKHASPYVREGLALAIGRMSDRAKPADLVPALEDKDERVRRAAALGLPGLPGKDGVAGLLDAWEKEKLPEIATFYRTALEEITGKFLGSRVDDWRAWWKAVESDWAPPKKKGEGDKGEKSADDAKAESDGTKASQETTTLRDVELAFKQTGKGGPLFVLPDYGLDMLYMEKHLGELEDTARLFYITLPGATKFKNLPRGGTGLAVYPIDKLCEAFDELRQSKKQERIAIMAHGIAAWVAMHYATKYPKNVSHLILISTWTSGKAWGDARARVEDFGRKNGDPDLEHFAANCLVIDQKGTHKYEPKDTDDGKALRRAMWTGYFSDVRSLFAALYWPKVDIEDDMGNVEVPDFDVGKEQGNRVPTLIIYGTHPRAAWTSSGDMRQLAKYYPTSEFVECPGANFLPMIEDHDRFMKAVKGFFKKYPFPKAKK